MTDTPLRVLHFADAHIDMANYGRRDQESALPIRVMDFLSALDQIIDTAVEEPVDLVIFAGDAYKDRNPQPTFQREWGKRMMRLSQAGIPTLLLIGNHDVSPATGRAHTLQEFNTLGVPNIHVADRIQLWNPEELGLPLQILTVPWLSRSKLMTREEVSGKSLDEIHLEMENRVTAAILKGIEEADPQLPLILTAHASVSGASYGSEQTVSLGRELTLPGRIISDKRLDYVALGHIHKHQALSPAGAHPPVIYPGSIERIDFGEVKEKKGFVLANVTKGNTAWEFIKLKTRRFLDIPVDTDSPDTFMADIMRQLPEVEKIREAICRVRLTYPVDWEPLLDEKQIADYFNEAFSLHIQKQRLSERRSRLGDTLDVESLTPIDLLEKFWQTEGMEVETIEALKALAAEVLFTEEEQDEAL
jgi:DNA repair protein SbcD/Mre11